MFESMTNVLNRIDFTTTFTNEYDADQSNAIVISPTTGKKIKVAGIYISTEGGTSAGNKIRLSFDTSGDTVCTFFPKTTPDSTSIPNIIVRGEVNEALSISSNLGPDKNYFVAIDYREE